MNSNRKKVLIGMCKTCRSKKDKAYKYFYLPLSFIAEAPEIVSANYSETESFEKKDSQRVGIIKQNVKLLL